MKVISNGFNLYGQLNSPDVILKHFTSVFEEEVIRQICVSHSISALLLGHNSIKLYPKQDLVQFESKIITITSNDERVIVLDDINKLYKLDLDDPTVIKEIPNFLLEYPDEKITIVSCGSKITIVYTNNGKLFNLPQKVAFENRNVIDIKCGREHCLLLDKIGNVYSFGRGSRGQLGHGSLDDEGEPQLIDALAGIKITKIAAGGWHSCAVSGDGDLYIWGWNGNGQLGIHNNGKEESIVSVMASPNVVDFVDTDCNVSMVACGNRHTIVLLDNNHLMGCGWNKYNQLKSDMKENYYAFTDLYNFQKEEIIDIMCGPWNTIVLCK